MPGVVGRRCLLARCLIAGAALAGCSGLPGPDEEALLLAYGTGAPDRPGEVETYRTMVLLFSEDSVRVVGEARDVVIPLTSGFARMGVVQRCAYDSVTGMNNYRQEVGRTRSNLPAPWKRESCSSLTAGSESPLRGGADSLVEDETAPNEPLVCDDVRASILFAAPGAWAEEVTAGRFEDCEPRGGRYSTTYRVVDAEAGRAVSLAALFDSATAWDAYRRALVQGLDSLRREGWNCLDPANTADDLMPDMDVLTSWGVRHARGAWRAFAAVASGYGTCQFFHEMDLWPPDGLIPDASRGELWPALSAGIPGLLDYVVSPRGGVVVALVGGAWEPKSLVAYAVDDAPARKLWERRLSEGAGVRLVVVRWGTGREARQWAGLAVGPRR